MIGRIAAASVGLGLAAIASHAKADGFVPYYGYSGYYGRPVVTYTRDLDVQQATTMKDAYLGFGITTYTTGGPFWAYRPYGASRAGDVKRRPYRARHVLRVRG